MQKGSSEPCRHRHCPAQQAGRIEERDGRLYAARLAEPSRTPRSDSAEEDRPALKGAVDRQCWAVLREAVLIQINNHPSRQCTRPNSADRNCRTRRASVYGFEASRTKSRFNGRPAGEIAQRTDHARSIFAERASFNPGAVIVSKFFSKAALPTAFLGQIVVRQPITVQERADSAFAFLNASSGGSPN